jgi:hypothetical protein
VKASTHTEVYRRYTGTLRPLRRGFAPIASSGVRVAFKSKWPLLFYAPTLIATIVFSFVVYAKFALEQGVTPGALAGPQASAGVAMVGAMASKMIEVRDTIVGAIFTLGIFSVLLVAWYGAGLFCEDRRVGAHLLYFARPITRRDYLLGKLGVVGTYVLASVLVPGLVISGMAAFASPDWSFLKEQWRVPLTVLGYAFVHTLVLSSIVLAISSLCTRKVFALVATVGYFALSEAVAALFSFIQREQTWRALSPLANLRRVAAAMFGVEAVPGFRIRWEPAWSWGALAALVIVAWAVLAWRVRSLEEVA